MGRPSNYEIARRGDLRKLSYDYLIDNFHTFDKLTKIRVALEIVKKDMPVKADLTATYDFRQLAKMAQEPIAVENQVEEAQVVDEPKKWTLKEVVYPKTCRD